jgi:hypothetical protein
MIGVRGNSRFRVPDMYQDRVGSPPNQCVGYAQTVPDIAIGG